MAFGGTAQEEDLHQDQRQDGAGSPAPPRGAQRDAEQPQVHSKDQHADHRQTDRLAVPSACGGSRYLGGGGAGGLAGWGWARLGLLPGNPQLVASADRFEAPGDAILDPLQAVLVGGFGAQRQRVRGGRHGALAPGERDDPVSVRPLGGLDRGERVTVAVGA